MIVVPPSDHGAGDLYMMLGRLDGKLDGISAQLTAVTARADNHERRIGDIEHELGDRAILKKQFSQTVERVDKLEDDRIADVARIDGGLKLAKVMWTVMAVIAAVISYVGYQVEFQPTRAVSHTEVQKTVLAI